MKRTVLVFGLIAGLIVSGFMDFSMARFYQSHELQHGMLYGYAAMIIALSFVFVGIKSYRDKYCDGVIPFGKAFITGLFITLVASTIYVITWLILYYGFMPDFMTRYAEHMISAAKASGATAAELDAKVSEMKMYQDMYKNPLFVVLLTYLEILPVGLVITAISALILKRKPGNPGVPVKAQFTS